MSDMPFTMALRAVRRSVRAPSFALTVLLLVGAVVAVNATAFAALHALRWKALPYPQAGQLVELKADLPKLGFRMNLADRFRERIAADAALVSSALGFLETPLAVAAAPGEKPWRILRVTPDFTSVLGVAPTLGRGFIAADTEGDAAAAIVLSDAAWRSRYGADPALIGTPLTIGGRRYVLAGVMPADFAFPDRRVEAWVPLVRSPEERAELEQARIGDLAVLARLTPDTTPEQARERLAALFASDERLAPLRADTEVAAAVQPWRSRFASGDQALALLQTAALILLAVAAANLVNLLLDRLLGRLRELDIRRALGAGDGVIVRAVLTDLTPPLAAGLIGGLALAPAGLALLERRGLLSADLPQGTEAGLAAIAAGVLAAAVLLAAAALAAWTSRASLRLASRNDGAALGRVRGVLLVAQIMLTTALVGSGALLLRSAGNLLASDRGFDEAGVVLTRVDAFGARAADRLAVEAGGAEAARYATQAAALLEDVRTLPGVRTVSFADMPPFSGNDRVNSVALDGLDAVQSVRDRPVGRDYFAALGIAVTAGRDFVPTDVGAASVAVIVDERFAQRYFPDRDPLSARLQLIDGDTRTPAQVVGIARTIKNKSLEESDGLPMVYRYLPDPWPRFWLVTRADADPHGLLAALRERVQTHFPDAVIGTHQPLEDLIERSLTGRRALLEAIGGFAVATLLIAGVGLAAVLGFAVRRRHGELGVRAALGATPRRIGALVLAQGGRLIALGVACGLAAGLGLARVLADRLFGLSFADPATWTGAVLLVATIAMAACWLPARRAAATDPAEVLRRP